MSIPYATVTEFSKVVDVRALAELGGDSDADSTVDANNAILTGALTRASHEVRSYALRGAQYSSADLDTLQAADDWSLKGLVCDIALGILIARRVGGIPDSVKDRLAKANQSLLDLRDGKIVFGGLANVRADAGVPGVSVVSIPERERLGMATDQPFYPSRRWFEA
jgi:hypothetical protein